MASGGIVLRASLPAVLFAACAGVGGSSEESRGTAQAPLVIGDELSLDPPVSGPSKLENTEAAVAFGAGVHLVVWVQTEAIYDSSLWGARVDASGQLLDERAFLISDANLERKTPAVAFDGSNFLAVWDDNRNGASYSDVSEIWGARISPAGTLLDPNGFSISSDEDDYQLPDLAFDGSAYMVVWSRGDAAGPESLFARGVSTAGVPTGAPIPLGTFTNLIPEVSIAHDGAGHLVAWRDSSSSDAIRARRLSNAGTWVDGSPRTLSNGGGLLSNPSVASDGNGWLVGWGAESALVAARVAANGTPAAPRSIATPGNPFSGQLAAGSGRFLFQHNANSFPAYQTDAWFARFGADGSPIDSQPTPLASSSGVHYGFALTGTAAGFLGVFAEGQSFRGNLYGVRFDASGSKLGELLLTRAVNFERHTAVAFDGSNFLVVWEDDRGVDRDVYGVRVATDGSVLDAAAVAIASGEGDDLAPAVVFDGTSFVVAWSHEDVLDSNLQAARLGSDGRLLDSTPISVCDEAGDQLAPSIASDGAGQSLIAWEDHRGGFYKIYAARVTQGSPADADGFPLPSDVRDRFRPAVAFGAGNYLVAWSDQKSFTTDDDILASRVSPSGDVLDATPVVVSAEPGAEHDVRVAFGAGQFGLVWTTGTGELHGARLDAQAQPLDATPKPLHGAADPIAIAWDGTRYFVAWEEGQNLRGLTLDESFEAAESAFEISASADPELAPAAASDGRGRLLVAYGKYDPALEAERGQVRLLVQDYAGVGGGPGSGGSAGAAGSNAVGGSSGTGGASMGGSSGAGASSGSGKGASSASPEASEDDGGCSCRTAPVERRWVWMMAPLLVGLALVRRRAATPATQGQAARSASTAAGANARSSAFCDAESA
jgi:large repetitive protein